MPKPRANLIEGEYDQITENCNRMRKQFYREVLRDVTAWLLMHWLRHASRSEAADIADETGNREWAAGVRADAQRCCDVIQQLVSTVHDKWTVKDWHDAQNMLDLMLAARGPDGKPLHVLGGILTSSKGLTDALTSTGIGEDLAFGPQLPPSDRGDD